MRIRQPVVAMLVVVFAIAACMAQRSGTASEPAPSGVERLAWMAGSWIGEQEGTSMEELWLPPRGDLMLGLHRDVFSSGKAFFEYLRIERGADGRVVYMASPNGAPATPFHLVPGESEETKAVFANPEHDFPQRILYWLEGDVLYARIEGTTDGAFEARQWEYRRGPAPRAR